MHKVIKVFLSFTLGLTFLFSFLPAFSFAQTSPLSLPLLNSSQITYLGKFNLNAPPYGGAAVGVSEDGKYLYTSCWVDNAGVGNKGYISTLQIPPLGGTGAEVVPCRAGVTNSELVEITGDPTAYFPVLGSILENNGKFIVGGFITYDASGLFSPRKTFWSGTSLTNLVGPYEGSVRNGLVKGQSGIIPPEWRSLLGGDSYVGAGYSSIISRSSYGPAFTSFNSADVNRDGFPMNFLLGCPYYEIGTTNYLAKCDTRYGSPQSIFNYNGSEQSGGSFIVPGTRTFVAIEREALGPTCYGYATRIQADHGKPYLDAIYCYSLSDTQNEKGPKGYPYQLVAKLYDLKDLVDVKNGLKKAWDIDPYDVVYMPNIDSTPENETIGYTGGGVFNPVTGHYYLTREMNGPIDVFGGFGTSGGGGGDTIPPSNVSVTAPSSGATVSNTITISANASDNVGVAGVQFKVDGINVGTEDTTSPYSISWDSKTLLNGSHTITAVARDASYNMTTSSGVNVTISNITPPPPTDPVGHWKLDEISGTSADDSSIYNNDGTLTNGPTWVPGKLGNALSFDGVNDYISINNSSSLALGNVITMAGWVNLNDNSVARIIVAKEDGAGNGVYLRSQGSALRCNIGGTLTSDAGTLNTNTWNHVACVYNGSNILTYVNGVQVGSMVKSGTIGDNSGNWNIGARLNGAGMLMNGKLDDIRVYARALSASEIQALYNSGGAGGGGDTTSPSVSVTSPSNGSTLSGTASVSASASDNVGVVGVQFKLDGVNLGSEDTTSPYTTTWDTTATLNGGHTITGVARDSAGNTTTSSGVSVTVSNATTFQRTIQIDLEGRTNKTLTGSLDVLTSSKAPIKSFPFTTNSSGQATITFDISPQTVYLKLSLSTFLTKLLPLDLNTNTTYTFPKLLVGDINQDNLINSIDYSALNTKWFTSDSTTDLNNDGLVNSIDLSFINKNWLVAGDV